MNRLFVRHDLRAACGRLWNNTLHTASIKSDIIMRRPGLLRQRLCPARRGPGRPRAPDFARGCVQPTQPSCYGRVCSARQRGTTPRAQGPEFARFRRAACFRAAPLLFIQQFTHRFFHRRAAQADFADDAFLVDEEHAVGITVEGYTEIRIGAFDLCLQIGQIFDLNR